MEVHVAVTRLALNVRLSVRNIKVSLTFHTYCILWLLILWLVIFILILVLCLRRQGPNHLRFLLDQCTHCLTRLQTLDMLGVASRIGGDANFLLTLLDDLIMR